MVLSLLVGTPLCRFAEVELDEDDEVGHNGGRRTHQGRPWKKIQYTV